MQNVPAGLTAKLVKGSDDDNDIFFVILTGTATSHAAANRPTSNDEIIGRTLTFKLDFKD